MKKNFLLRCALLSMLFCTSSTLFADYNGGVSHIANGLTTALDMTDFWSSMNDVNRLSTLGYSPANTGKRLHDSVLGSLRELMRTTSHAFGSYREEELTEWMLPAALTLPDVIARLATTSKLNLKKKDKKRYNKNLKQMSIKERKSLRKYHSLLKGLVTAKLVASLISAASLAAKVSNESSYVVSEYARPFSFAGMGASALFSVLYRILYANAVDRVLNREESEEAEASKSKVDTPPAHIPAPVSHLPLHLP